MTGVSSLLRTANGTRIITSGITSVEDNAIFPGTASAAIRLESDGDLSYRQLALAGGAYADSGDWCAPKAAGVAFEVYATLNSGSLTSGTTGAWEALTADRTWLNDRAGVGTQTANITLQIRRIGTTTPVYTSSAIDVTAEVSV